MISYKNNKCCKVNLHVISYNLYISVAQFSTGCMNINIPFDATTRFYDLTCDDQGHRLRALKCS